MGGDRDCRSLPHPRLPHHRIRHWLDVDAATYAFGVPAIAAARRTDCRGGGVLSRPPPSKDFVPGIAPQSASIRTLKPQLVSLVGSE